MVLYTKQYKHILFFILSTVVRILLRIIGLVLRQHILCVIDIIDYPVPSLKVYIVVFFLKFFLSFMYIARVPQLLRYGIFMYLFSDELVQFKNDYPLIRYYSAIWP